MAEARTGIDDSVATHPMAAGGPPPPAAAAPQQLWRYGWLLRWLAEVVGKPPAFNLAALTLFWRSKLRYASQAEVLRVQREHVSKGLNQYLSMLIIDCHH